MQQEIEFKVTIKCAMSAALDKDAYEWRIKAAIESALNAWPCFEVPQVTVDSVREEGEIYAGELVKQC